LIEKLALRGVDRRELIQEVLELLRVDDVDLVVHGDGAVDERPVRPVALTHGPRLIRLMRSTAANSKKQWFEPSASDHEIRDVGNGSSFWRKMFAAVEAGSAPLVRFAGRE
jgi:hypothetical protein